MKKIYFLLGERNTGKTTTFKKLYELMKNNTIRFKELIHKDMSSYSTRGHKPIDMKDDFYAEFEDVATNKKIVLFSMGDYYYDIFDVISRCVCDILFCALNRNIESKPIFSQKIDSIYHPEYINHNFDVFNSAQANVLLSKI